MCRTRFHTPLSPYLQRVAVRHRLAAAHRVDVAASSWVSCCPLPLVLRPLRLPAVKAGRKPAVGACARPVTDTPAGRPDHSRSAAPGTTLPEPDRRRSMLLQTDSRAPAAAADAAAPSADP